MPAQEIGRRHRLAAGRLDDLQAKYSIGAAEEELLAPRLDHARGRRGWGFAAIGTGVLAFRRWVGGHGGGANSEPSPVAELQVGTDMRGQPADDALELDRRAGRVEMALLGGDLLRVCGVRIVLLGERKVTGSTSIEGAHQKLSAQRGEPL